MGIDIETICKWVLSSEAHFIVKRTEYLNSWKHLLVYLQEGGGVARKAELSVKKWLPAYSEKSHFIRVMILDTSNSIFFSFTG